MALPKQIQAQLERADAALAELNAPPAPPAPPEPPAPTPAPIVEVTPPPPAPGPAAPAPAEDWQHKYNVLRGMFNQQATQLRELKALVEQRPTAPPAPTPAPTPAPQPVADPKDIESFGLDMVTMVQRTAETYIGGVRQQIESKFAEMAGQIARLSQMVEGTTQTIQLTAEERFFKDLDGLCPVWEQVNKDEGFLAYLAGKDPIYGLPRSAALKNAQDTGDAERAANIFKAYIATMPPTTVAPPAGSPTPRGAAPVPPAPPAHKPLIAAATVAAFYDDVKRGRYRGNEAEAARLEAEYNAALAEGRVR